MTDKERYQRLKREGVCTSCRKPISGEHSQCPTCLEKARIKRKERYWKDVEKSRKYGREKGRELHLRALKRVMGSEKPACKCGCDNPRVLEINHKNGDGWKERQRKGLTSQKLYLQIIHGKRSTDDLEITCKVCNISHYCFTKFGLTWKILHVRK